MKLALEQASIAMEQGDVPIGAVAVRGDDVIAVAGNRREALGDPTAHAELLVLREAAQQVGSWRLNDVTVFVTLEPCPMCAGALVASRIERLVYGAPDPKAGAAWSLYNIPQDPRLNHRVEMTAGVLEGECAEILTSFFKGRRRKPPAF